MEQPFIQIGQALVNVAAIAAAKKTDKGILVIRLLDGKSLLVKPESADLVWNALVPFVNQQHAGAPHAVLADPVSVLTDWNSHSPKSDKRWWRNRNRGGRENE